MNNPKELIIQEQKQALEELTRTAVALARLRKLVREQGTYEPAAFEESLKVLMGKVSDTGRKFSAHVSILLALRNGRVKGVESDSDKGTM